MSKVRAAVDESRLNHRRGHPSCHIRAARPRTGATSGPDGAEFGRVRSVRPAARLIIALINQMEASRRNPLPDLRDCATCPPTDWMPGGPGRRSVGARARTNRSGVQRESETLSDCVAARRGAADLARGKIVGGREGENVGRAIELRLFRSVTQGPAT